MKKILLIGCVLLSLAACSDRTLYSHYEHLESRTWPSDSVLLFCFDVADSLRHYDVVMNIRHTEMYPYQNIWLFTGLYLDSICLQRDTLEYYLADKRGQWLGNGFGNLKTMPMLYKQNLRFVKPGHYRLEVQQGMRESHLPGVNDFGLTITEYGKE